MDEVQFQKGKYPEPDLALYLLSFYISNVGEPAVLTAVPVISQEKILIVLQLNGSVRPSCQGHLFQACLLYTSCKELKEHKADKVIVCCTFGLFTNGLEKFDEYYHQGYLDYVITTNLNYRTQELLNREWYLEADMSKYLAAVINSLNHDRSISASLSPTEKIQKLVQKHQNGGYEYFQKLV